MPFYFSFPCMKLCVNLLDDMAHYDELQLKLNRDKRHSTLDFLYLGFAGVRFPDQNPCPDLYLEFMDNFSYKPRNYNDSGLINRHSTTQIKAYYDAVQNNKQGYLYLKLKKSTRIR